MKSKEEKQAMSEVTKGYEKFIADKKVKNNGKNVFDKVIKKAVKQPSPK